MLIKIIHMTAGMLVIVLFYAQAIMLLRRRGAVQTLRTSEVPRITGLPRFLKIAMHICWTIVILAGVYLLLKLPGIYPYWLLAKILLFVLAIIFSIFSFRGQGSKQAQNIGLLGAAICYALIILLVVIKPWGFVFTGNVNQPVSGSAGAGVAQSN
jgi:uncharacterized membrane protein SirB2